MGTAILTRARNLVRTKTPGDWPTGRQVYQHFCRPSCLQDNQPCRKRQDGRGCSAIPFPYSAWYSLRVPTALVLFEKSYVFGVLSTPLRISRSTAFWISLSSLRHRKSRQSMVPVPIHTATDREIQKKSCAFIVCSFSCSTVPAGSSAGSPCPAAHIPLSASRRSGIGQRTLRCSAKARGIVAQYGTAADGLRSHRAARFPSYSPRWLRRPSGTRAQV